MPAITITFEGERELLASFSKVNQTVNDSRPTIAKLGDELLQMAKGRIDRQGYTALSPGYARRKAREFPGKPILRATDRGYESFNKGASDNVYRVRPLEGEFGTSVLYMLAHQEGLGRLPVRMAFDVKESDEKVLEKIAIDDIADRLRGSGFDVN